MTLAVHISMFYSALKNIPIRLGYRVIRMVDYGEGVQKPEAIELLNRAWAFVCNDLGPMKGYYDDTLIQNQSEYEIPKEIIKVHRVRLLDGHSCLSIMIPTEASDVLGRDATGEIPAGIPHACSVTWRRSIGTISSASPPRAKRVLKFDCPPCWGGAHGIEVFSDIEPTFIDQDDLEPELPPMLQDAGRHYACFLKCSEPRFNKLYEDARNAWLRTGADLHPMRPRELLREGINASSRFYY